MNASPNAFQAERYGSSTSHTQPAQPASPASKLADARDTAEHAAAAAARQGPSDEVSKADTEASMLAPPVRTSAATEPARYGFADYLSRVLRGLEMYC